MIFILRLTNKKHHNIFSTRSYFSTISRKWQINSNIVFVQKNGDEDFFVGAATIEKIDTLSNLDEHEKKIFINYNYHVKLSFKVITRFLKPIPVSEIALDSRLTHYPILHGERLDEKEYQSIMQASNFSLIF